MFETKNKKIEELDKEIFNTFKKVWINIPLLDAIRQIPKYAKFLEEVCTNKRRVRDNEVVNMGRNVSSLIKRPIEYHVNLRIQVFFFFCSLCDKKY